MKKISIKLKNLLKINYALEKIVNDNENEKVDPLFKFKILGIMKSLESHVENFNLIRNQKIMEYGKLNDDGDTYIQKDDEESIKKFNGDMIPVLETCLEIEVMPLSQEDVFSKDFDVKTLIALYPIIDEKS